MAAQHTSAVESLLLDDAFDGDIMRDEPLARHTTLRVGGPARYFIQAHTIGSVAKVLAACAEDGMACAMIGRGSNLLVSDEGYDGAVITLGRDFRTFRFDEETMRYTSGAAVVLSTLVHDAFHRMLAGLEFAVDTPGSVGGALRMNAGTADEWIGSRVVSVTVMDASGAPSLLRAEDLTWGYRTSSFAPDQIILECELSVEHADPFFIRGKMEAMHARRTKTQPMGVSSCGSVFKNPKGASAAQLIEGVGLKGATHGAACISDVHANFIVNKGGAQAADIIALMGLAQAKVNEVYGIELQPEVKFLGFA